MYAEVIPQIRIIPKLGVFDYEIPKNLELKVGDIVKIEFRNTKILGVVYKLKKNSKFKKVKEIVSYENVSLSKKQLSLMIWLSDRYNISKALAFKIIFPEIPKRSRDIKKIKNNIQKIYIKKNKIKDIRKVISFIEDNQKSLLIYADKDIKNGILMGLQKKYNQTLIIEPEKNEVLELSKSYSNEDCRIIYSGLSKNYEWKTWNDIKNNKVKLIVGTKNAAFIPTDNIKLIIIDDEQEKSHHNFDQNPKYHVLEVVEKIQELDNSIKILVTSQAPSLYSYVNYNKIDISHVREQGLLKIIDMHDEKKKGNYSYLSDSLLDEIENNKKSLILFNRKGDAKMLLCKNCSEIMPYESTCCCSNCKSMDLRKIVFGTTNVKLKLEKRFPTKKIIELTKDVNTSIDESIDIIIGTEFALRKINLKNIDFIGVISVDHQLIIPEKESTERVFQYLVKLINMNKKIIIQTHAPDNLVFKVIKNQNHDVFYEDLIKIYNEFNFPIRIT